MSEAFHVDTEVLRVHAQRLRMVTDSVSLAADAARAVNLHDGAFGLLCAFLPPVLNGAETTVGDALGAAQDTVSGAAAGVRAMARDYDAVDDRVRALLTGLERELR